MEFKGRYLIPASADAVWAALNDPDILQRCIPGCDRMEKTDPTHFSASATLKIGPVKAAFRANIALADLEPPRRCTLKGEGQGGVAGFARGEAEVELTPDPDGTVLTYSAQAMIGGKLAQIGQRLIDGAAKQIADDFFARFASAVGSSTSSPAPVAAIEASPDNIAHQVIPIPESERRGLAPEVWVVGLIAIIAILLLVFGAVVAG